jgi:DNA polymerase
MQRGLAQGEIHDDAPVARSLKQLREFEAGCRRCPLYRDATQVVPGEGPRDAHFLLVGEQPGDQEDKSGHPFVGPAGRMLDQALEEAGIARTEVFVTNAVKHFKFEMRGKRRLHQKPNANEIARCNWWLHLERRILKPRVVVALGATAARALLGKAVTIAATRRRELALTDGAVLVVTIHPSALLRTIDAADKQAKYREFVTDLEFARKVSARS